MSEPHLYRKADPPTKGPAFDNVYLEQYSLIPGAPALMFDLSKLTLADYAEMRTHPQVNASLSLMTFMLHQCDWRIECEDKKIAAVIEDNMRQIWTPLVRGISTAYWAGYAPMVLEWDNAENGKYLYIDKIKDLHPAETSINWKEVDSNYTPRPEDEVAANFVKPKVKIFDGIRKFGLPYPVPPEHSFWYPMLKEHGNMYGRNLLKPAFAPWYFSLLIHLFANRYFERFGEPTPIGRAPFDENFQYRDESGQDIEVTGKQLIERAIDRLRSSGRVTLPSDRAQTSNVRSDYMYDIEYLESAMRGADFERYMARLDEEISLAIFMPMLLVRSGDRGSLALGVQHTQTWLFSLNALAMDLKQYIDAYLVQRIKAFNFSARAPKAEWVVRPMGKDNSETLRAIITTLIRQDAARVDLDDLGVALGMRIEKIDEVLGREAFEAGLDKTKGRFDDREVVGREDRERDAPDTVADRNYG